MRAFIAAVATLAVLGSGCAKPEAQVVGKWQFDAASMSTGDAQKDSMMKSMAGSMTMEFKADKTFTGPMMEGTYEMNGHTISVKPTKMLGMDISKLPNANAVQTEQATLSDDGKSITIPSKNGSPVKLVKA